MSTELNSTLFDMHFPTDTVGYAICSNGVVLKYEKQISGTDYPIYPCSFAWLKAFSVE